MKKTLSNLITSKLYVILDLDYGEKKVLDIAEAVIQAGVRILQLRGSKVSDRKQYSIGQRLRNLTRENKVSFIINNRADVCKILDADGVHLGQEDLPVDLIREFIGEKKIIGLSTHSLKQVEVADDLPVDYISLGPIFKSITKPDLASIGENIIDRVNSITDKPIVLIGGINKDNVDKFKKNKFSSVAVISAIAHSEDIKSYTEQFIKKIKKI